VKKIAASLALAAAALATGACEPAPSRLRAGAGPVSGPIALTDDDGRIIVAAEDHDEVLVIDRGSREVRRRIAVGQGPSHLILSGSRAIVTSRYGHVVSVVDVDAGTVVRTVPVGAEPLGLVALDDTRVAVALAGAAAVAIVDTARGVVDKTITLPTADPRAVALLPDGDLYVAHMAAGRFSRVDVAAGTARIVDVTTRNEFGPRLSAEHLRSLTVDPERGTVMVAHSQANEDTVRAPIGDPNAPPVDGSACGYSGCPTEVGAVVPGVTEVDPADDAVVVPQVDVQDEGVRAGGCFDCDAVAMPGGGFGTQAAPPSVLNPFDARFGGVQLSNPTVLALFDGGRGQLVVNMGTNNVLMLRRDLKGRAADVVGVVKVGAGAQGVALRHDGEAAYVWNQFDGTISEIALPVVADTKKETRFADGAANEATIAEFQPVAEYAADTFAVVEDALDANASLGRRMFHDATDSRISAQGTVSCASCHPDGRADGRTWQFTFGPRNTPQLGGDILDTAPFHWPGDVPTVAALNDMTVLPFMGGSGLDAASFQFVAAYIGTIRQAPSTTAVRDLNELERRGAEVFFSEATQCGTCHSGAHFTDNVSYDVGTQANARDIRTFQTPVLHGLHRSAPYGHDGKYPTMRALVDGLVRTDKMGKGSHLSNDDVEALVAYLNTL
jgi:DNA-binding beta-propeller fold protein YncE/mono/diheme cytochrome c family protein